MKRNEPDDLVTRDPQRIRRMFAGVAPRYNLLNHLLSGCMDRKWRREFCRAAGAPRTGILPVIAVDGQGRTLASSASPTRRRTAAPRDEQEVGPTRILDICAGTGHLAREYLRQFPDTELMVVSDFVPEMLARCPETVKHDPRAAFACADALRLPFADASFDLAMNAFGFRNTADPAAALAEMVRVVRPGGLVGLLEFFRPRPAFWRSPAGLWVRYAIPVLGAAISPNPEAYRYLPSSMNAFMSAEECAAMLSAAGCDVLHQRTLAGGVTTALVARKRL